MFIKYNILENAFTLNELKFHLNENWTELIPHAISYYYENTLNHLHIRNLNIDKVYKPLVENIMNNINSKEVLKKYLLYQDIIDEDK